MGYINTSGYESLQLERTSSRENYMTSEFGTQFLGYVREMVNASAEHVKKDESDVEAVVSQVVNENWINPFYTRNTYIVSISNGVAATPNIAEDLEKAKYKGGE